MLNKELQKLNLSDKEASVYLALLELGEGKIEQVSKKAKVKRTTVYTVLGSLEEKGLAGKTTKKKKTLFYALNPKVLDAKLDEKKAVLQKILPDLLSITNSMDKKPGIRFFEGTRGIKEIFRDTLNYPDQETLAWASEDAVKYFDVDWLWDYYVVNRVKNKIWQRTIMPETKYMKKVKAHDVKHLRKTCFSPADLFPIDVEINLYGKRYIGIMSFKDEMGLIIESEGIFNTLKSIFEMNWKLLSSK